MTTLTRPVSGEKQNSSGNVEILQGIGKLWNFSFNYDIFRDISEKSRMSPKKIGTIFQILGRASSYR